MPEAYVTAWPWSASVAAPLFVASLKMVLKPSTALEATMMTDELGDDACMSLLGADILRS